MNIVGQDKLIADMERVVKIFQHSEGKIRPHFILTGPSGCGKSETVKTICQTLKINYFEINAAQLTKEGTSGNSLSKALTPLTTLGNRLGICFVDEFDKLFISGNSNSDLAHESTNGVQNEFLKVLESEETAVFGDYGKYINVSVKNVLFIFAGAFNGEIGITLDRLRDLGLKTEFLGRVGLVFNAKPLKIEHLFKILDNSEILDRYLQLFPETDREKTIYTLRAHLQKVSENNTLGARLVNTMINQFFINGGKLEEESVEKVSFQKPLKLEREDNDSIEKVGE